MPFQVGNTLGIKGREKGTRKEKEKNKVDRVKNIILDECIKRRPKLKDIKTVEIIKLGASFVPKEDTLTHDFALPALSIITRGVYNTPYIDINAEVSDASDGTTDSDGNGSKDSTNNTSALIVGDTKTITPQPATQPVEQPTATEETTNSDEAKPPHRADKGGEGC